MQDRLAGSKGGGTGPLRRLGTLVVESFWGIEDKGSRLHALGHIRNFFQLMLKHLKHSFF